MRGTVKFFDNAKGWGFITTEDGTDVFIHWTGIINMDGFKHLEEGQAVTFDVIDSEKGKQAVNVEVINEKVENIGEENMMNKDQTIDKILDEYGRYGIEKELAELVYDNAIKMDVPKEAIYPGMRLIFNNNLGIEDENAAKESGKALVKHAIREVKNENPETTDKVIADGIETVGMDVLNQNLKAMSFPLSDEVDKAVKNAIENFVANNK